MRTIDAALDLHAAGIMIAGVDQSGAIKVPATTDRRAICAVFRDGQPHIPAAVLGNGLVVLRFNGDEIYRRVVENIRSQDRGLFGLLAVLRSPSGQWTMLVRVQGGTAPAGEVLALDKSRKPLVEMLGAGDLVVFGGQDAPVWRQGNLKSIPTLPQASVDILLAAGRMVNEWGEPDETNTISAPKAEPEPVTEAVTAGDAPAPIREEAPQAGGRAAVPDLDLFERQSKSWSVIPLKQGQKRPEESKWQDWCSTKRPFRRADFQGRNAGVACGPASGVLVLDLDDLDAFNVLAEGHRLEIPDTYTVRTGSGKPHFYFQYPEDGREYGNMTVKHPLRSKHTVFDMRGLGGQVVAAGSIHPDTGRPYVIERHIAVAPVPAWILKLYNEGK